MQIRACVLVTVLLGCSHGLLADTLYSVKDLGTLGGDFSRGSGINNAGQVTGQSSTSTGFTHAFLYSNGQMMDLGTPGRRLQ